MTLGKLTDKLTEALDDAADAIEALHLGVSAKVGMGTEHHLMWCKRGSDWVLLVGMPDGSEHEVNCVSRALRIMVAATLPLLHEALVEANENTAKDVTDAIAAVEAFTKNLRTPQVMAPDHGAKEK